MRLLHIGPRDGVGLGADKEVNSSTFGCNSLNTITFEVI